MPKVEIESLTRLDIKPGEILAVELPVGAHHRTPENLASYFRDNHPEMQVMVYIGPIKFKAIRKEDVDAPT